MPTGPPLGRRPLLKGTLATLVPGAAGSVPQARADPPEPPYLVGRGIADITGEAAETGMMGYARLEQQTSGIHQRQRSRAFVMADRSGNGRVALVTAEVGMIFAGVRAAVLHRLAARHGSLYTARNVLLTGTHTHAGRRHCVPQQPPGYRPA